MSRNIFIHTIFLSVALIANTTHAQLSAPGSQLWAQGSGIAGVAEASDGFGEALTSCDFNGDGWLDLAIGTAREDNGSDRNIGVVDVIYGSFRGYGSPGGLTSVGAQHINLISESPPAQKDDNFGSALASGDLNGDGFCDLAIGAPFRKVGAIAEAGAVYVIYGAGTGLNVANKQVWSQASSGIGGNPEEGDFFGFSLAIGDFDGNGHDDLAVGAPGESIGSTDGAGLVHVIYAADDPTGLTAVGNQGWFQGGVYDGVALPGLSEESDHFGIVMVAGDFDGNGKDDLVLGVPNENIGELNDVGLIQVLYGAENGSGLSLAGYQAFSQGFLGLLGSGEASDEFGGVLAVGDFDGNGKDDLAVGVPDEDFAATRDGVVQVIYGKDDGSGLSTLGNQLWSEGGDIVGSPEDSDNFGSALTVGDFDGNGKNDLAIGVKYEDIELLSIFNSGTVVVIYGADSGNGLSSNGNQLWHQHGGAGGDIPGVPEEWDLFGASLAAGDFNGNGRDDLAVGAPGQFLDSSVETGFGGEVSVIYARDASIVPELIFKDSFESP